MIDLHCHSTASDGTCSPQELVDMAAGLKLTALALTDHDTIDGIPQFMEAAKSHPELQCIPGIELSCQLHSGFACHIVGLFIDKDCRELLDACKQYCVWRVERNLKVIEILNTMGCAITYQDVLATKLEPDDAIGRPHIANALVAKGYCTSSRIAFERYIGRGRPAYVARQVLSARDCLDTIHAAGGLAIWAHPMTTSGMTYLKCERIIKELKQSGLDGIEAYYTEHNKLQIQNVIAIAKKYGIFISGGSDFHGTNQKGIHLATGHGNLAVPDALLQPMFDKLAARR